VGRRTVGGCWCIFLEFFIYLLRVSGTDGGILLLHCRTVPNKITYAVISHAIFFFSFRCTTARSSRRRQHIIVPLVLASFRPLSKTTCTQSANSAVRPLDQTRPSNQPTHVRTSSKKMNMIIRPYPTHNVVPESWIVR
jgi:hypothetical protein